MDDWAGSLGLNYRLTNKVALYALGGGPTRCRRWMSS
jgi:hypothetical protein